ncbi:hypothetical protein KY329_05095 [Candidatus Woesearchaeota archaeon]|nr:hypothetical protein [Candidatus Woesearchaeota archaeon]
MEFPWWLWIAVGIPVLIISSIAKLYLFIAVGLVFTALGIGKVVYEFVLAPRKSEQQTKVVEHQKKNVRYCPRCYVTLKPGADSCRICGLNIK